MFTIQEISTKRGVVQYRREHLTGYTCRVSTERAKRGIDKKFTFTSDNERCPFCPERIFEDTPTFDDGRRICVGESVTFPNLFPFAACHTVTVITRDHNATEFSQKQIADALEGQAESLSAYEGYGSINWNFLPSSGASIAHPHMQGIADPVPTALLAKYIVEGQRYMLRSGSSYWEDLRAYESASDRFLFGDEIIWAASAVPLGEREIRGLIPARTVHDLASFSGEIAAGLHKIIRFYRTLGNYAFNASVFFEKEGIDTGFRSFCTIIARINPNTSSTSDSAFMERLHREPVILTLPENLAAMYHGIHK